jgi:hypothetical protein
MNADMAKLLNVIGRFVSDRTKPLKEKIAALESRIAEFEKSGVRYCGVYQRANEYKRGSAVTADGSMFVAVVDVAPGERPGWSQDWVLSVKHGKDAVDPARQARN